MGEILMKKSFKRWVQMFILGYTMIMGFWLYYALAWTCVGLPMKWWSSLIILVFAMLSFLGWMRWIEKG